jgi:hypothetical protein
MKGKFLLICCFATLRLFAQNDTTVVDLSKEENGKKWAGDESTLKVFYAQRLIDAKTVEVLHKGVMAFTVIHTFGDIAGKNGGFKNFFGLDDISDAQIGVQLGLTNHLNVLLQHTVGSGNLRKFYELGLKYQFVKQGVNGSPISVTAYANLVSTANDLTKDTNSIKTYVPGFENSFRSASDRLSELGQLMIAKRFGNVSLQVSGTFLHTNVVLPGEQNNVFAIGAAARLPLSKKVFVISDYFHSFHSQESIDAIGFTPTDVFGIGVEILTQGHVFHMNFTNARNILENRFLRRTTEAWDKGQFRWGFTISRNFMIFRSKSKDSE